MYYSPITITFDVLQYKLTKESLNKPQVNTTKRACNKGLPTLHQLLIAFIKVRDNLTKTDSKRRAYTLLLRAVLLYRSLEANIIQLYRLRVLYKCPRTNCSGDMTFPQPWTTAICTEFLFVRQAYIQYRVSRESEAISELIFDKYETYWEGKVAVNHVFPISIFWEFCLVWDITVLTLLIINGEALRDVVTLIWQFTSRCILFN
jgi:hypothetical protein